MQLNVDGILLQGSANASDLDRVAVQTIDLDPLQRIVCFTDPRGVAADRFRLLRMRLSALSNTTRLKNILITSALAMDGKSTVSLNLATALAEHGKHPVLLVEADLYHPTLVERLGIADGAGLAQCLGSGLPPLAAIRRIDPLGWYLLAAGGQPATPSDLLHSEQFPQLLHKLSPYFKWILIDSPPIVPVADTLALARHTDASLLVVRAGRTPAEAIEAAIQSLGKKHVAGIVLNGVEGLERRYAKYNKHYLPASASDNPNSTPER